MSAPDAQPPAAWWNPSTANTSTTPTIVRWFDAAGREIPAPKDGYTDEQFRRASAAVARCFALDAEVAPTRSREFYNEIAHSVLAAALAGTTTPTGPSASQLEDMAQTIDDALDHTHNFGGLGDHEEWLEETARQLRKFAALLASTPTEETPNVGA